MEMEHIDENTIRVLINDEDLEERGITMLDLLGNQRQIESFFYSILEEVDIDETFRENDMITFQVVPNTKGLELYISKDGNLDMNVVNKIQNYHQQLDDYDIPDDAEFHWIGAEANKPKAVSATDDFDQEEAARKETVFEFPTIEEVIIFAHHVTLEDGLSYLHAMNGRYYLTLVQFTENTPTIVLESEICMALEFGERSKMSFVVIEEYGKEIMQGNALELLRKYFELN